MGNNKNTLALELRSTFLFEQDELSIQNIKDTCNIYGLNVTRDKVYDVMYELDPEGLEARGGVGATKKERRKRTSTTRGANWVHSLDGHGKIVGYKTPLSLGNVWLHASRKLLWLKVWIPS